MNIADKIRNQFPEFMEEEYPSFIKFVEHYYEFLESGEVSIGSITGTYTTGETVTGSVSGASATIRAIDVDNSRIFVSTQNKFVPNENLVGQTSAASSKFVSFRPNPIQTIDQLLDYRDIDSTVAKFFDNFREEFMATIPNRLAAGADKRGILKNITDLYREKGTKVGHQLFFKILLGDDADIYYPSEDILEISGGKWSFDTKIRVIKPVGLTDISTLIGSTIKQLDNPASSIINPASATIDSVSQIYYGAVEVLEIFINVETIEGIFIPDETIYVTGLDGTNHSMTLSPLVVGMDIKVSGQNYSPKDVLEVSGFGMGVIAEVEEVTTGYVKDIIIVDGGSSYTNGASLTINNTGTGGTGTSAEISALHGLMILEDSGEIIQEDRTVFESGIAENNFTLDQGDSEIVDTRITQFGANYTKLPTITATGGQGSALLGVGSSIGGISSVNVIDPGFDYSGSSTGNPYTTLLVSDTNNTTFEIGSSVTTTTGSAIVVSYLSGILKLKTVVGTISADDTITNTGGSSVSVVENTTSSIDVIIGAVATTSGSAVNEDGFLSAYSKRIHDGTYYQYYSYLVKTAESITNWRSALKSAVHPAGFAAFGEVNITSKLAAGMKVPTLDSTIFTPELFSTFKDIFSTVLRRKLGSTGDGDKNPTPMVGGSGTRSLSEKDYDVSVFRNYVIGVDKHHDIPTHTLGTIDRFKFIPEGSGYTVGDTSHPDTLETFTDGVESTFLISDFSSDIIGDYETYKDRRDGFAPPSEITYKTVP